MEVILLIAAVTACLLTGLLTLLAWDVRRRKTDDAQPWLQALRHYLCLQLVRLLGALMSRRLQANTCDVGGAQRSFLLERLQEERGTEYGKLFDFASMTSVEDFRSRHPLTTYDHYAPYVQRMQEGEVNILTSKQPVIFGVSSGTSGASSKIIPMLRRQQTVFFMHGVSVLYTCLLEAFPVESQMLRKSLKLFYNPAWRTSKAGIPVGPNSSTPKSNKSILHMYTTPAAGYDIAHEPEALYVQLLFALKDRQLGSIEGNFASLVYNAMKALQSRYRQLARDLATGTLNPELQIDPAIRSQLEELLQPDCLRAEEVVEAFSPERGGVVGVCQRLWPELYVVLTVDTGTFAPYGQKLRETFLQGVPIYSPLYAATEGLVGINLWPLQQPVRYLPHPAVQFFEFIPVEASHEHQPRTLLLHEVEPDHEYEVVLTNVSGLYRYRLGDIVRVVGFHNQCPTLQFLCRVGQFLNVRGEKTCERTFYEVLSATVAQWPGLTLVDYCCAESILLDGLVDNSNTAGPCYHVFLELEGQGQDGSQVALTPTQREGLDRCLCDRSYPYASFRRKGAISGMQLHLLRPGAFQDFRHYVISSSEASSNQFKVPRVVRKTKHVEFLWQLRREMRGRFPEP